MDHTDPKEASDSAEVAALRAQVNALREERDAHREEVNRLRQHGEDLRKEQARAEAERRFLSEVTEILGGSLDYAITLERIAALAVPEVADLCVVLIQDQPALEGEAPRLRVAALAHRDPRAQERQRAASTSYASEEPGPLVRQVLREGRALLRAEVSDEDLASIVLDPGQLERLRDGLGVRSLMAVPLRGRERVMGVLGFLVGGARRYRPHDLDVAQELGRCAALAVERAQIYQEAQEAARHERHYASLLRGLSEAALAINSNLAIEPVLQVITDQARLVVGAHQSTTTMVMEGKWGQAVHVFSLSDKYAGYGDYHAPPDGSGIYRIAIQGDAPLRMTQAELLAHPAFLGFGAEAQRHPPMRGWLAAPLINRDGKHIGLLQLSDKYDREAPGGAAVVDREAPGGAAVGDGEFSAEDEIIIVQLARLAALAIDNARLYREAQEAVRSREEFLSIASHELRSPLNTLSLQLQLLMRAAKAPGGLTSVAEERLGLMLETCQRQLKRLTALINRLFDLSRLLSGRLDLTLEELDLAALAREVSGRFEEEQQRAGSAVVVQTEAEAAVVGHWDRLRLEQVMTNLLSNAQKYGEGKPIKVIVAREGALARLTVIDQGIGIAPEHQARIFERFERATTQRTYGSLGLGLYIVRRLLELMGGTIRVDSRSGAGSTFIVELPLALGR